MNLIKNFEKPIRETIKDRISVRSYDHQDIPQQIIEKINSFARNVPVLFDTRIKVQILNVPSLQKDVDLKLGTYGIIRGTNYFIASTHPDDSISRLNAGYVLEYIVLYAASLGLGSCWLAGTFNRSAFSQAMAMKKGEVMPAIIALGYPIGQKTHLLDSIFRVVAKSRTRKSWDQIFFNENFSSPLSESEAGQLTDAFEMLRLAPSASNKQPWRLLKCGNRIHFYIYRTPRNNKLPYHHLAYVDLGIGMAHFELTNRELGLPGVWEINDPVVSDLSQDLTYVITWVF
jgi:nitroreductase